MSIQIFVNVTIFQSCFDAFVFCFHNNNRACVFQLCQKLYRIHNRWLFYFTFDEFHVYSPYLFCPLPPLPFVPFPPSIIVYLSYISSHSILLVVFSMNFGGFVSVRLGLLSCLPLLRIDSRLRQIVCLSVRNSSFRYFHLQGLFNVGSISNRLSKSYTDQPSALNFTGLSLSHFSINAHKSG